MTIRNNNDLSEVAQYESGIMISMGSAGWRNGAMHQKLMVARGMDKDYSDSNLLGHFNTLIIHYVILRA